MSNWKNIELNANAIKHQTGKAFLIKLPKSEFTFWHPAKLCRTSGKGGYKLSISFTKDFSFNIFRTGANFKKLAESTLNSDELVSEFNLKIQ